MSADDEAGGAARHEPVLVQEVVTMLQVKPNSRCIDATLGLGGHAAALLAAAAPGGQLLGIERDGAALALARERLAAFGERAVCVQGTFGTLAELAAAHGFERADAVLFDLGVSSLQLDDAARGFSVQADAPLDMRMDQSHAQTAADIVNTWAEEALSGLLREAGDEPLAAAIARAAGRSFSEESTQYVRRHGPIPVGEAVVTGAGNLPFKGVIHAVGPMMGDGNEEAKLAQAVKSALLRAHERGWTSLSFPAISSGIYRVPPETCARAYVRGVREFNREYPHSPLKTIRLCLVKGPIVEAIKAEMGV